MIGHNQKAYDAVQKLQCAGFAHLGVPSGEAIKDIDAFQHVEVVHSTLPVQHKRPAQHLHSSANPHILQHPLQVLPELWQTAGVAVHGRGWQSPSQIC